MVFKKRRLHMRRPFKIKTRLSLVACLLAAAIAMAAWSDTLILRNGTTFSGTLTEANSNTITFRDRRGEMHRYSVRDVEAVQFGDAPYSSGGGPGQYGPPNDDRRDDRDRGNYQRDANRDNNSEEQTPMEAVGPPD